jgi:hypothetical protein
MIDQDPIGTSKRRRRKQVRFGSLTPVCVLCGNGRIHELTAQTPDWLRERIPPERLIELHHAVGEQHDPDLVVPVCRNCHASLTEGLAQAGITMLPQHEPKALVALMLDALAYFFELLVDSLRRWAQYLRNSLAAESTSGK